MLLIFNVTYFLAMYWFIFVEIFDKHLVSKVGEKRDDFITENEIELHNDKYT